MDDFSCCQICGSTLRVSKRVNISFTTPGIILLERTCAAKDHVLQIFVDTNTKKIHKLRMALSPNYTKIVEFDFITKKTKIEHYKMSKIVSSMEIPRLIELDFPTLKKLKEKISLYMMYT